MVGFDKMMKGAVFTLFPTCIEIEHFVGILAEKFEVTIEKQNRHNEQRNGILNNLRVAVWDKKGLY